eukprot:scaffold662_cov364-Pavlova_lutheri.AAC.36
MPSVGTLHLTTEGQFSVGATCSSGKQANRHNNNTDLRRMKRMLLLLPQSSTAAIHACYRVDQGACRKHCVKVKQNAKHVIQSSASPCPSMTDANPAFHARELPLEAQDKRMNWGQINSLKCGFMQTTREGACSVNVASDRLQTITTTLNGVSAVKERASTNLHLRAVPTIELYKGCPAHHQSEPMQKRNFSRPCHPNSTQYTIAAADR